MANPLGRMAISLGGDGAGILRFPISSHQFLVCNSTAKGCDCQKDLPPPRFNMEPENDVFRKESPFPRGDFQVPC